MEQQKSKQSYRVAILRERPNNNQWLSPTFAIKTSNIGHSEWRSRQAARVTSDVIAVCNRYSLNARGPSLSVRATSLCMQLIQYISNIIIICYTNSPKPRDKICRVIYQIIIQHVTNCPTIHPSQFFATLGLLVTPTVTLILLRRVK